MKKGSFALAMLFATTAPRSAQSGITGTWRVEGVGNPFPWEVVLRAEGSTLTGAVSSCANTFSEVFDGKIDGNTITFNCKRPDRVSTITFNGTLNGDEIAFTWEHEERNGGGAPGPANGLFGPSARPQFTAKRVPDGALAADADAVAKFVRGMEFAAAVNLRQKDMKIEGRLFFPNTVGRMRTVIVVSQWGRGENFYNDPRIRRLLVAMESGLLVATTSDISSQVNGLGALNNAAAGGGDALLMLMQRLAQESGHQELADAPLLFWGHSAAGIFGSTFAALHPQRTIAFVCYQSAFGSGDLKVLSQIPVLFFAGGKDTSYPISVVEASWKSGRGAGAPWTFAVQPDATHGDLEYLRKADDLVIAWITAVLRQRLSLDGAAFRAVTDGSAWLGNNRTGEAAPYATFTGPKSEASWLPDEATALGWRATHGTSK